MARRPIGPYVAGGINLVCAGCGKQDAFEQRNAFLLAALGSEPRRRMRQVICWNCGAVHWFSRDVPGVS